MPRIDYHFLKLANGINLYIFALTQHNKMNKEYEISCNLTDDWTGDWTSEEYWQMSNLMHLLKEKSGSAINMEWTQTT